MLPGPRRRRPAKQKVHNQNIRRSGQTKMHFHVYNSDETKRSVVCEQGVFSCHQLEYCTVLPKSSANCRAPVTRSVTVRDGLRSLSAQVVFSCLLQKRQSAAVRLMGNIMNYISLA